MRNRVTVGQLHPKQKWTHLMTDSPIFTNPDGLYDPSENGYSHLAEFPADWRVVLPAGQSGEDENGDVPEDFADQLTNTFRNLDTALRAAGGSLRSIAKMTHYIVDYDMEKLTALTQEVERIFGADKPAATVIPVSQLALPDMKYEIDVIAAVPPKQ